MLEALKHPFQLIQLLGGLSLFEFIQVFWNEVSDDEFQSNWHIPLLCSELETLAERVAENKPKKYDLIINIPPGTTKTIICSIMFPAWCWTKWYWMRFITGSYSDTLALESAEKSRDIIRCDKFKMLYPHLDLKQDKDVKSNFRVIIKEQVNGGRVCRVKYGGSRFSTSVGGSLTGFHGHILIWDDPINPAQAVSEKQLLNANNWLSQTASTRKVDKRITPMVMIMQRLHQNDPSGFILSKNKDNVRHICLPGEIKNYRDKVRPVEFLKYYKKGLLDEQRLDWKVLKELEADLGQYGYAGQIGQNPTPPGGGMFKVDQFQIFEQMIPEVNIIETIRYWDKAGTMDGGAYTAGVKIHLLKNGKYLVSNVKRGQWSTEKREEIIRATAEADGRDVMVWIEQEPGSGGKESAENTIKNLSGFVADAERPTGDKVYRAGPWSTQVNWGNVYLLHGDWNQAFIEEHRFFPFSKYKDQVDGASGAYNKLSNIKKARVL